MRKFKAWHFLQPDMTAGSGNEPAWTVGETRTLEGEIVLCQRGYHASKSALDALFYAQEDRVACRVEVGGTVREDSDKVCGSTRTLLWALDVQTTERVLHLFACAVAEDALKMERKAGRETDTRSWATIETKRKWTEGSATDNELDAARAAAWAAASAAAWAAESAAAWAAASAAASAAERAAAWAAARARYSRLLSKMLTEAHNESLKTVDK